MQLDADLGIDSIKRVEILSALQDRLPGLPALKPEQLGSFRTLRAIVEFLGQTPARRRHDGTGALRGAPQPRADVDIAAVLLEIVAEKTGYPAEMLELDMRLDADLGIDSIKRVEILSALQERLPELPAGEPEQIGALGTLREIVAFLGSAGDRRRGEARAIAPRADAADCPSSESVARVLLEAVAEKTGYPVEMLELDMRLDADLGIDSIKRVEILSAVQDGCPRRRRDRPGATGHARHAPRRSSSSCRHPPAVPTPSATADRNGRHRRGRADRDRGITRRTSSRRAANGSGSAAPC